MKTVLFEAILVTVIGGVIALAANALSPRGLKLSRDYFRIQRIASPPNPANPASAVSTNVGVTNTTGSLIDPHQMLRRWLETNGVHAADSNLVFTLHQDPRREQNLVIFIDSRADDQYEAGHIPGAYQLDYYRPEKYMPTVMPACDVAQQVVVYCNGGDCDDSMRTADWLLQAGVGKQKLLVYLGGLEEWATNKWPIELGTRMSGNLRKNP